MQQIDQTMVLRQHSVNDNVYCEQYRMKRLNWEKTCLEARTTILCIGSKSGTRTTDLTALNRVEIFKKSSSICARGQFAGLKINSLQETSCVSNIETTRLR